MTNEEAKQEAIKKAYGNHYDDLKPFINKDGWILGDDALYTKYNRSFDDIDFSNPFGNQSWRPIELTNLENNQGWIRIEPDGSNLPDKKINCKWLDNRVEFENEFYLIEYENEIPLVIKEFTHYKIIKPPLKPIY